MNSSDNVENSIWLTDWAQALQCAQETGKIIFMLGDYSACPYARKMWEEFLSQEEFLEFAQEHYILLHDNNYGISPIVRLFDAQGEEITQRLGFSTGDSEIWMQWIKIPITETTGVLVDSGGNSFVDKTNLWSNASVYAGESAYVAYGGITDNIKVAASGIFEVHSGGVANNTSVNNIGEMFAINGTVNSTVLNSGGHLYVHHSGKAYDSIIKRGGNLFLWDGGSAARTNISGGYLIVESGGSATSSLIGANGALYVSSGGVAESTVVNQGGSLVVSSGGTCTQIKENGGYVSIAQDANVTFAPNEFSGLTITNYATIHSGTVAIDITLKSWTDTYVYYGGIVSRAVINSGMLHIINGGSAIDTVVQSGGRLYVNADTMVTGTIVNSGGSMLISSGANISDITADEGAALHITVAPNTYIRWTSNGTVYEMKDAFQSGYVIDKGGTQRVLSGGLVDGSIVNSGGQLLVSSGGSAVNITAMSGSVLRLSVAPDTYIQGDSAGSAFEMKDGQIADYNINSQENLYVSNGGIAIRTHVAYAGGISLKNDGTVFDTNLYGAIYISSGGVANDTYIGSNGTIYVSRGGLANKSIITSQGELEVKSGGVASDTVVHAGGSLHISSGGKHRGELFINTGGIVSAYQNSTVEFSLASRKSSDDCLINNLSLISGTPTYIITVSANQAWGEYKLAQGANNFTGSISIGTNTTAFGSLAVNGEDLSYGNRIYSLDNINGSLTLSVSGDDTEPPVAPLAELDNTEPTNVGVIVTVTYSDDSIVKQYRIEQGEWVDYTSVFMVTDNTTLYLRAEDAAGNESTSTLVISNIDKVAPTLNISGNPAEWTNQDIVLSATASDGTVECLADGEWIAGNDLTVSQNGVYRFRVTDAAGNITEESVIVDKIDKVITPQELLGSANKLSWQGTRYAEKYVISLSSSQAAGAINIEISGTEVDLYVALSDTLNWQVAAAGGAFVKGNEIAITSTEPQEFVSDDDGNMDIFFANANGTWSADYAAQHTGLLNGWHGTKEHVALSGKNKLADIFEGSNDANILLMTDDTNGDALFVDDIYTALPGTVAEQQARIAQIDEIRAGAGDDIVDMTSQRFEYVGDGVKIYGGLGNDTIWANNGSNTLFGDAGNDRLVGGANNDVIVGGIGNDSIHGGGGDDIFCFGGDWGNDTVKQLADGKVTLWFEDGSESNWNASTLTYTDGVNTVKISGVDSVTLKFGADVSLPDECFADAASEKIFEDKDSGMLA